MNKSILTTALLTAAMGVQADAPTFKERFYAGLNVGQLQYEETGIDDDARPMYAALRAGAYVNENVSVEARYGTGIGSNDVEVCVFGCVDVDVEVENFYGLYTRLGTTLAEFIYPYAVVGYTRGEIKASAMGFSATESESDISYGVGVDLFSTDNLNANVEFMQYIDEDTYEAMGISAGLTYVF